MFYIVRVRFYYLNQKFVSEKEAKISISDLGFLRGFGVFDLAAIYNGRVFLENEHLKRLRISARLLGLKVPYSLSDIKTINRKLMAKNKIKNGIIRWILTGGVSRSHFVQKETFAVLIEKEITYPDIYYNKGVKVVTRDVKREMPEAKTLNYQIAYSSYPKMAKEDAFELVYTPNNRLLEATTSNFFIVKNKRIISAKKDILTGITREVVIDLAEKNNIPLQLREVKKDELGSCDEAFLTATTKKIMPVTRINNKKVGSGQVGAITKKLTQLFNRYLEKKRN